jgi:hypothetical protein
MSFIIELYYKAPANLRREADLSERVRKLGGQLDYREEAESVCLTYEFDSLAKAESAALALRSEGEHVEGPVTYAAE